MKTIVAKLCLFAVALGGFSVTAKASLLDFSTISPSPGDYGEIPGTFGSDTGTTPNIGVSYASVNALGNVVQPYLGFWGSGYGDLPAVAYPFVNGEYAQILLTPQAGYSVTLSSFDLATYNEETYSGQTVEILNGSGGVLWSDGTPGALTLYTSFSSHLTLTPGITSTGPLTLEFGPSWNIGVNDVAFSQQVSAVPEPTTIISGALLLLPFGSSAFRQLRKKLQAA
jgi:hypothetical protein